MRLKHTGNQILHPDEFGKRPEKSRTEHRQKQAPMPAVTRHAHVYGGALFRLIAERFELTLRTNAQLTDQCCHGRGFGGEKGLKRDRFLTQTATAITV